MKNEVPKPSQSINTESRELLATVYWLLLKFSEKTKNETTASAKPLSKDPLAVEITQAQEPEN